QLRLGHRFFLPRLRLHFFFDAAGVEAAVDAGVDAGVGVGTRSVKSQPISESVPARSDCAKSKSSPQSTVSATPSRANRKADPMLATSESGRGAPETTVLARVP